MGYEFKASLGYLGNPSSAWAIYRWDPVQKKKNVLKEETDSKLMLPRKIMQMPAVTLRGVFPEGWGLWGGAGKAHRREGAEMAWVRASKEREDVLWEQQTTPLVWVVGCLLQVKIDGGQLMKSEVISWQGMTCCPPLTHESNLLLECLSKFMNNDSSKGEDTTWSSYTLYAGSAWLTFVHPTNL